MSLDFYHTISFDIHFFSAINIGHFSLADLIDNTLVFAQSQTDLDKIDIIGDIVNAWENFVKTGQSWAMLIGVFLGYAFRSFLP